MIHISSNFDAGNIDVIEAQNTSDIQLRIRCDHQSEFYQWFYYRLTGAAQTPCRMRITNAGGAAYAEGWAGYHAVASYDREHWFRVHTNYKDGELLIEHEPQSDSVYYAYFAPYSMERHADLVAQCASDSRVRYTRLGGTLDGRDMDLLRLGEGERQLWVIARQHPGETMAEWWMEGFLGRLLDEADPIAREVLRRATLYVVPNMNPDGSFRGHLRTNAAGANLNREWAEPTEARSPEVLCVREHMQRTGVDFSLDVHGDEALPHNFIAGAEGIPSWTPRLAELQARFQSALVEASPDFQTEFGYEVDPPRSSDLRKCTDWVAENFDCLSMTLEMPFKDTTDTPLAQTGWSPARCRRLGEASLTAIARVLPDLR